MTSSTLGQLAKDDKALVLQLLNCIVDTADGFLNEVHHHFGDGLTEYIVKTRENSKPAVPNRFHHASNVAPLLAAEGLAVESPSRPRVDRRTGVLVTKASSVFMFTSAARMAYEELTRVSDAEVQRRIGLELFSNWKRNPDRCCDVPLDVEEVCGRLGLSEDQFFTDARVLTALGYAGAGAHGEQMLENGFLCLTTPKGIQWANVGCPPIGADGAPTVNVTLSVTVTQVIEEVDRLGLSANDRVRVENLLKRFEDESRKRKPSYKPLQDLLAMAANVKDLAPPLIRFFAEHADDIQRMSNNFPGS